MREFFHGWRRRAGCATLVMALIVGVTWGRSYFYEDHVWIAFSRQRAFAIHTAVDHIAFSGEWQEENGRLSETVAGALMVEFRFDPTKSFNWVVYPVEYEPGNDSLGVTNWYWGWEHFGCGEWDDGTLGFRVLEVPYWVPVLASSLLSAYLLLVSSRERSSTASHPHA
jgi:hypothetical protein